MKKIIAIGLYLTLLGCSTNPTEVLTAEINADKDTIKEFSSHIDLKNGFSLDYPTNWDTINKDSRMIFMSVENDSDTADKFNENLNLTIVPNEGKSLDSIASKNIKAAKEYYGDIEIKTAKTINDNKVIFISLSLVQKIKGLKLVSFTTFYTKGDKLYTLSQTTETKKMEKYGPIYQHIINSFNWTAKN